MPFVMKTLEGMCQSNHFHLHKNWFHFSTLEWNTSDNLGKNVDGCTRLTWTDTSMCLHLLQPPQRNHAHYHFNLMYWYLICSVCTFWKKTTDMHLFSLPSALVCFFIKQIAHEKMFAIIHTDSNVRLSTLLYFLTEIFQIPGCHGIMFH